MRLIDADKLIQEFEKSKTFEGDEYTEGINTGISWCTEDTANAPTVNAIPIDWIIKWANKNCMYCCDYDYPTERTDGWFDINDMVKDWKKENGTEESTRNI